MLFRHTTPTSKLRHLVDKSPRSKSAADKEALALEKVCAAVEVTQLFDKMADGNGKTRLFHVIVYIDPLSTARRGNLWPY